MKYKVLVLLPDLSVPGGVSNYFEALELDKVSGVKYFFVNDNKKEFFLSFLWRMISNYFLFIKILIQKDIELVHVNPSLNFKSYLRDSLFVILAKFLNVKTLVFFHGWSDDFEQKIKSNPIFKWIFLKSFGGSEYIVVLSNHFKEKLIALGSSTKKTQFWIETTVADTSFLEGFSLENKILDYKNNDNIKILFLSRIEEEKGVFIALDAFNALLKDSKHEKLELIIAGDGNALDGAKEKVAENNIPNVVFTGYIRGEEKKRILHDSHIFLFPTYYGEGMPTNILEAMLYGMPIISRYNAGIADAVSHGDNGFLTESKDSNEFREMLKRILNNDELFTRIVRLNHKKALENYSSEKVRGRLIDIYESITGLQFG